MAKNRGPEPSKLTRYLLIARSAGRCQICNEFVLTDSFTMCDNDDSNVAHIVASSPDGPRGDAARSHALSDDVDNLMIVCRKHHKMIDDNVEVYTEEFLKELKLAKEKRIWEMGGSMDAEETEIVIFQSPIKNIIPVNVSYQQALKSIILDRTPITSKGIVIDYKSTSDYHSREYWEKAVEYLDYNFVQINSVLRFNPETSFSVFPIAPIPLIIRLGYMFGDKIFAKVSQKYRSPDTWSWLKEEKTNSFSYNKEVFSGGKKVAIILALTSDIDISRVSSVCDFDVVYKLDAGEHSVDCIRSEDDLKEFWHKYQEMLDEIKNLYPDVTEVSLFPSVPVSAAFAVGSRYMQGVYPKIHIYDDDDGFFETITIGE